MGFLGSRLGLTPNLDALANQSVIFTHAYAQAPLTTASHATILSGTYPQFHKVNDFDVPLGKDLPYAPEIFGKAGYATAAFVGSIILDPRARFAPGFERGFQTYDAEFHRRLPGEDRYKAIERRADEVVARSATWLQGNKNHRFFLWVHLYDAHDPYDPPEPFKSRYRSAPYDGEIAFLDSAVGQLLSQLKKMGAYENTLIAVMADHGEGLGDHGEISHGIFLYDETIHVPLLFKLPYNQSRAVRVDRFVELVDVLPTILQASGVAVPRQVQGSVILPQTKVTKFGESIANAGSNSRQLAYSETDYPRRAFGWSSLRALRNGKFLFVQAPHDELYDESIDPQAKHNLYSSSDSVSTTLLDQIGSFREKTASARVISPISTDPEQREKLAALGYVPSDITSATLPGVKDTEADPKDKIETVNLLHRAELLSEDMRYQEAVPLLEQAIKIEPNMPISYLQLGTAYTILKDYPKALPVLRKAVELRPDLASARFQLGSALLETGQFAEAVEQFELTTSSFPDWAEAHFYLATCYARTNRLQKAAGEYRRVIDLRPKHYGAHLLLGRALALTGELQAALKLLQKAAELQPESAEPHQFLADVYQKLNRKADAAREVTLAKKLGR